MKFIEHHIGAAHDLAIKRMSTCLKKAEETALIAACFRAKNMELEEAKDVILRDAPAAILDDGTLGARIGAINMDQMSNREEAALLDRRFLNLLETLNDETEA